MIRFFFLLLPLLFLCSCAAPTTRRPGIPAVDSYDMREIRRELRKFSYDEATRRRQRLVRLLTIYAGRPVRNSAIAGCYPTSASISCALTG